MAYAVQTFGRLPKPDGLSRFRAHFRRLWVDRTIWTRSCAVGVLADLGDEGACTQRLLRNADSIGQALEPFVGPANALRLRQLLRNHTLLTLGYVRASKHGDTKVAAAAWDHNTQLLAKTLASISPRWPEQPVLKAIAAPFEALQKGVKARLGKDWNADVAAFELELDRTMYLADLLAGSMIALVMGIPRGRK